MIAALVFATFLFAVILVASHRLSDVTHTTALGVLASL